MCALVVLATLCVYLQTSARVREIAAGWYSPTAMQNTLLTQLVDCSRLSALATFGDAASERLVPFQ